MGRATTCAAVGAHKDTGRSGTTNVGFAGPMRRHRGNATERGRVAHTAAVIRGSKVGPAGVIDGHLGVIITLEGDRANGIKQHPVSAIAITNGMVLRLAKRTVVTTHKRDNWVVVVKQVVKAINEVTDLVYGKRTVETINEIVFTVTVYNKPTVVITHVTVVEKVFVGKTATVIISTVDAPLVTADNYSVAKGRDVKIEDLRTTSFVVVLTTKEAIHKASSTFVNYAAA